MPASDLPDFGRTLALSRGNLDAAELAECHGALCGLLCRNSSATVDDYLELLDLLQLLPPSSGGLTTSLEDVFSGTGAQLADEEMGFQLWLPDDAQTLVERTTALAQWCTGFLADWDFPVR